MIAVLLAGGAIGLLSAAYYLVSGRPYRARRNPRAMALVSVASLAIGALSFWLTLGLREPRATAPTLVHTDKRFSSSTNPSLTLDAPEGWRIEFDRPKGLVSVVKGTLPASEAPAVLTVDSFLLQGTDFHRAMVEIKPLLEREGLTMERSASEPLSGKPSMLFSVRTQGVSVSNWLVKRETPLWSSVKCITRDGSDPRAACAAVLERLKWQTPTDLASR